MSRSIFVMRMVALPVVSAVVVATFPSGPAMAKHNDYLPSHPPCGVSHVDRAGPTSVRLYLRPSRSRVVTLVHAGNEENIGPDVTGPVLLVQLGDKITSRYATALPRCSMAVIVTKGRIGVEVQNKDQWSWPPDIFFVPAQQAGPEIG
jgi:hypothetical protein